MTRNIIMLVNSNAPLKSFQKYDRAYTTPYAKTPMIIGATECCFSAIMKAEVPITALAAIMYHFNALMNASAIFTLTCYILLYMTYWFDFN